jgi:ABC-type spermidine/putrescine transport system permease subunit I
MTDTLTTIMHLINSPPGQLAAGGALAGIVWKFFERVESVLTDQTKLEIAVWLLGVKVGQKVGPWPDTFAKVFDRVFGESHLSWKCFWRSVTASVGITLIVFIIAKVNPVYPFRC